MHNQIKINADAFSSGQLGSKIWLCDELEKISLPSKLNIYIYGGWYGILSLLLLSRNTLSINSVRSFDIDPSCQPVADLINENWVWREWQFKAFTDDCNLLDINTDKYGEKPNLIINTSAEHMGSLQWFQNLPSGMTVAIQSNDMHHDNHPAGNSDLSDFNSTYPMQQTLFLDQLEFDYTTWKFSRFMKIGIK